MKKLLLYFVFCAFLLSACSGLQATPTSIPPTATIPLPSATPETETLPPADGIGYYYFVPANTDIPQGSVVILPDTYTLAPERLGVSPSPDTAADLKAALQAVVNDPRNLWVSDKLEIASAIFDAGRADILLQGEIYGVGDVTLIAARMQVLLTIFANASVQSATVTFNGDTIANWGVSNSMNAKPADYVFTRAEIEAFVAGNLYGSSAPPAETQPSSLVFSNVTGDAGNFSLMAGETITVTWENAPAGAERYEFVLAPLNKEPSTLLGSDRDASDGVAFSWTIPEQVAAELHATAYFPDGRKSEVSFAPTVYSGDLPPAGVCSLLARHQPVEVYSLPDRAAEMFAFLYPAVYAHVLEITPDGWYRIDASVAMNSNNSPASGEGWVNGDKGVLLAGACPPDQP